VGAVNTGAAGNTTKLLVLPHPGVVGVVYVAVKHPAVVGVNTPVLASILPPPLTVHVPPVAPPVCVKVTVPPPIHEFATVTTGSGFTVTLITLLTGEQVTPFVLPLVILWYHVVWVRGVVTA
jgi:hypothetical protein